MKILLTIFLLIICVSTKAQKNIEVKKIIDSLNVAMEKAFNANDMMKVAAFYADNAEISGENYTVSGRKQINDYWMSLKDKGRGWKLTVIEAGGSGELVYQLGRSDLKHVIGNNPEPASSITNFVLIWEKQTDGSYKILRDYLTKTRFEPGN